jgi:molybdate/tungstate transport system substrate-binding protein
MNNRNIAIIAIIIIAVVAVGIYAYNSTSTQGKTVLTIYAADSLGKSMNTTAKEFEAQHPNVTVQIQYGGSSALISQITQLNKTPDIMASADYGLIDSKLIPKYASWNLQYAHNELVIAYTNKSKFSNQINGQNWYQIFSKSNVTFGFSDPNSDPAGYRAVMMMQLANSVYNNNSIFSNLVENNTAITSKANGTGFVISAPSNLNPSSKVTIRPAATDLMPLLQSGSIDYVIIYKSVAQQQNLSFVPLPAELSLKNTTFTSDYSKISLIQDAGTNQSKSITLTPIVYGITILNNAPQNQLATEFLQLLLSSNGTQILQNSYQEPITPAIATNDSTNIPDMLKQYIKQG